MAEWFKKELVSLIVACFVVIVGAYATFAFSQHAKAMDNINDKIELKADKTYVDDWCSETKSYIDKQDDNINDRITSHETDQSEDMDLVHRKIDMVIDYQKQTNDLMKELIKAN